MNFKRLSGYLVITVLAIIIILMRECQHQRDTNGLITDISAYKDTAYYYELENGKVVAYNQTLELENAKQIKAILQKDEDFRLLLEGFKNLDAVGGVTTITRIIHDTINFTKFDTIPCDFEPIKVEKISAEYTFNGTITNTSFIIDSLLIPNEMKFVVGEKRTGLFKRESRIEVVNSNPLIQTVGVTAYTVEEKAKWGQKLLIFMSGVLVGVITYGAVTK